MKKPKQINLPKIGGAEQGYISVVEEQDVIPFKIARAYWTYYTPNHIERGGHAHINLEQILVAVSGVLDLSLESKTGDKFKFVLDSPEKSVYIPKGYWRDIRFSHNAVLLCLASEKYEEEDYIRCYDEFKK